MMRLVGGGIGLNEVDYIDVSYEDVRVFLADEKVRCFHKIEKQTHTLAWYSGCDDFYKGYYLAWLAVQMLLDAVRAGEPLFVFPQEWEIIEYAESKGFGRPR